MKRLLRMCYSSWCPRTIRGTAWYVTRASDVILATLFTFLFVYFRLNYFCVFLDFNVAPLSEIYNFAAFMVLHKGFNA